MSNNETLISPRDTEADRVRSNTDKSVNRQRDREAEERIRFFEGRSKEEISERIEELNREWDMERTLETNAAVIAFTGVSLAAATRNSKWLFVPGVVTAFLFQHAVQGWCPPVPVFRRMGFRTRKEIEREKYALKVLRGDFEHDDAASSADAALRAVSL